MPFDPKSPPDIFTASRQEMFDFALQFLRAQGVAGASERGLCKYRSKLGTSCAFGCLLTDELYHPGMEDNSFGDILAGTGYFKLEQRQMLLQNEEFFAALQSAHDGMMPLPKTASVKPFDEPTGRSMPRWENAMLDIAVRFHLRYTPPSQSTPFPESPV